MTEGANLTCGHGMIKLEMIKSLSSLCNDAHFVKRLQQPSNEDPEKVRYKVIGVEMKGMESSMKLVALGATQRRG